MSDLPETVNDNAVRPDYMALASDVVSAYVTNNSLARDDLPALITAVHGALSSLSKAAAQPERPEPPVPIKKSITPDYLISLEDGKHYKSLRRHLTARGLTPEQYRTKWGLSIDYPMVAANYAKLRSEMATKMGLGQKRAGRKGRRKAAKKLS